MAATAEAALSPACCKPPDGDFVVDRATFQHEFFNLLKQEEMISNLKSVDLG